MTREQRIDAAVRNVRDRVWEGLLILTGISKRHLLENWAQPDAETWLSVHRLPMIRAEFERLALKEIQSQ